MNEMLASVELSDRLYFRLAAIVQNSSGISLGDAKRELVRTRLLKRLRALGLPTFEAYHDYLERNDPKGEELTHMIDAISTNKTDFFRERRHFEFLANTGLPTLLERTRLTRTRRLRIWSAGCSSGEEPYSLAIVLHEALASPMQWDARILATDISTRMLRVAREGLYEENRVAAVPPQQRLMYFVREKTPRAFLWRVRPEIRALVAFRRLNLMNETYPFSGKFDIIFCRNVMIYFDRETQEALANRLHHYLTPGGYLFLGRSENLHLLNTPFRFVQPTIYIRP